MLLYAIRKGRVGYSILRYRRVKSGGRGRVQLLGPTLYHRVLTPNIDLLGNILLSQYEGLLSCLIGYECLFA